MRLVRRLGLMTLPLCLGGVCLAASLTPSLIPRGWLTQGILSGVVMAIGYLIGRAGVALWRGLGLPEPSGRAARIGRLAAGLPVAVLLAVCLGFARHWQNGIRVRMGMGPAEGGHTPQMIVVALVVFLLLLALGHAVQWLFDLARRKLYRVMPPRARMTLGQDTPQARAALLALAWRIVPAEAAQGAVLLSGCDGVQDNMARWAEVLYARTGRSAMILDSHGPRGLDRLESWRLVCAGQLLPGAERAGDLAVALAQSPDGGQTILGASHGGWTALEFLRLAQSGRVPPGLAAWPAPPGRLLARVGQVVLLYPYCGFLNRAGTGDWRGMPPILLIAAERDSIVSTPDCLALADRLRASGARIEVVVMAGADHGFDQKDKAALSALTYDPAATGAAEAAVAAFLTEPPE